MDLPCCEGDRKSGRSVRYVDENGLWIKGLIERRSVPDRRDGESGRHASNRTQRKERLCQNKKIEGKK